MKKNKIKIIVNGEEVFIEQSSTLFDLLDSLKINAAKIAIELNGEIIPKSTYKKSILKKGSKIEIVHFIGGG